ncbi:UDP-3-O-acyl-N-acetylglucosamine deacetylase [Roseicitreum antarcticum]|uniref:UDP-3-O-acyl-N-acetylglucosamine deacetylase n=1 Tax=Roseicitreum antarcticum TaxID=564137 RepID=A0A1H2TWE7_9RHOB|nr:UDP-3-O-acyl-N-acetylglucosamine deacetylase [Roseicitreum antarcticum]SDW48243.1 UDP-3-O-[3-hydroxymyristoyl] N-acetylglucosamine deacetylase [Roseicitreum antarcticum]
MQKTLNTSVTFSGFGLHSGKPVRMVVHPAPAGHGIVFVRSDVADGTGAIPVRPSALIEAPLCTLLGNDAGVTVATVEHLMAALSGCGINNARVSLNGPEVPILDGSAAPFVARFLQAGIVRQAAPLQVLRVLKPVVVTHGAAMARLDPARALEIRFEIDFEDAAIGHQQKALSMVNGTFVRELSNSRTFCRRIDVEVMQARGLALGGTYDNAVVVDGARVLSPGGLRHADEPVRHKMLDALGDLYVAGYPILARYTGLRAGHTLTGRLLQALFADASNYRIETCDAAMAARLPGAGASLDDLPMTA